MTIEESIIKHLIYDEAFTRKVLPFIKPEYFPDRNQRTVFSEIESFILKYNSNPTFESLVIELDKKGLSDDEYKNSIELLQEIQSTKDDLCKLDWLVDKTEKFCQDAAIYNGVVESIAIINGKSKDLDKGAIPDILTKALAVGFDEKLGLDYIEDSDARYEYYHRKEERIPFDLDYFNKITKGGLPKKSLTIILAGSGVGKSLFLCHHTSACLTQGKNVLYITLEMAEERIAERIDANLFNCCLDDLMLLSKEEYNKRVDRVKSRLIGKLIIKEYPTASANAIHFRTLLNELKLKRNFVPDIIFIDYLNICSSAIVKPGTNANSYTIVKSIAEELRALGVEFNVPIVTGVQLNRCLSIDTIVKLNGYEKPISTLVVGDKVLSYNGYAEVLKIFPKEIQKCYKITTKSGKQIICSGNHVFPTKNGEKSINSGLKIGDKFNIIE